MVYVDEVVNREVGVPGTLVIQPLPGIGDMVWHLPYLRAIAEASADGRITVLTKRRSLADQLFAGMPWVHDVIWLDRAQGDAPGGRHDGLLGAFRLAADLRDRKFDAVWILHSSKRYAWACRLAGIRHRTGTGDLPAADQRTAPFEKARRLLETQGLSVDPCPRIDLPEAAIAGIRSTFGDRPDPWLAVGIGASEPFKQWGDSNFADLARAFVDRTGGSVFLIGGPGETDLAHRIEGRTPRGVSTVLNMPLGEVAALCAACQAFIGNDTGILNLAAATGTPSVGLFGGSPPLPLYPNLKSLEPPGGAVYRIDRMAEIPVEEAMQALSAILDDRPVAGPFDRSV